MGVRIGFVFGGVSNTMLGYLIGLMCALILPMIVSWSSSGARAKQANERASSG